MAHARTDAATPCAPTMLEAFWFWAKLGCISFGGPAGQIAIMHQELVDNKKWVSDAQFIRALNYCMLLPGPEAQQLAIYLGWILHKTLGGVIAGVLFVLPALLLFIGFCGVYVTYVEWDTLAFVLAGIKPTVVAIVAFAAWRLGRRVLNTPAAYGIAIAAGGALAVLHLPYPLVIAIAALTGWLLHRWQPRWWPLPPPTAQAQGETTPEPSRTLLWFSIKVLLLCLGLWLLPLAALWATFDSSTPFMTMAIFFTKAAMVTFGGAYAVLPYIADHAATQYQWLSAAQMMDGLALGETTPGPLIMVTVFVGYLGAYHQAPLAETAPLWAGTLGAIWVAWYTFLPCFLWILAGAPWIQRTQNLSQWQAPLAAVTCAVVGVIVHLCVYFASAVLWFDTGNHWLEGFLALAAFIALVRFKISIPWVILAGGFIGWLANVLA